jgi:hypothetical protein
MSAELRARKAAQLVTLDAKASVARESDKAILTPRYTSAALQQMGWERSYGRPRSYRAAFATAFMMAWLARFDALGGKFNVAFRRTDGLMPAGLGTDEAFDGSGKIVKIR